MIPELNTSWKRVLSAGALTGAILSLFLLITSFNEIIGNAPGGITETPAFILLLLLPFLLLVPFFLIVAFIAKLFTKMNKSNTATVVTLTVVPVLSVVVPMIVINTESSAIIYLYMVISAFIAAATFLIVTTRQPKTVDKTTA